MKVYELIKILLEQTAGAKVQISCQDAEYDIGDIETSSSEIMIVTEESPIES